MHLRLLLLLGFLVFISPFVGIPFAWMQWILVAIGLAIMTISFIQYMRMHEIEEEISDYVESDPTLNTEEEVEIDSIEEETPKEDEDKNPVNF